MKLDDQKIAVIGLGYVGLPLAMEFAKTRPVVGFDIRRERIDELHAGRDQTLEVDPDDLKRAGQIEFTDDAEALRQCGVFIVTGREILSALCLHGCFPAFSAYKTPNDGLPWNIGKPAGTGGMPCSAGLNRPVPSCPTSCHVRPLQTTESGICAVTAGRPPAR